MQINQCSSGASLDQAHVLSCLCKLFVGPKMGNKHLPSTQRRKTVTEMGEKASVGKVSSMEMSENGTGLLPAQLFVLEMGPVVPVSSVTTQPSPHRPREHRDPSALRAGPPRKICLVLGPWYRDEQDNRPSGDHEIANRVPLFSDRHIEHTATPF